ncbi:endopeptidase La [Caproiciproducens faecalis]|uniref:Lon protease n=1 Tax=Caproiciproducens faecalis TaxID=2820301 RepID=A0ABS7DRV5_9FIRM|nr:endopeptidase La [Caproiciproducens faecalis]MBW7574031.1 endopeptidase La [Caproiciproducens faecalis]
MSTNQELMKTENISMPVLALRGLVIFPGMLLQFDVGRKKSILALSKAMEENQQIFLVAQKDLNTNEPGGEDLYKMGIVAKIKQVIRHTEEGVRLFAEGMYRAEISAVTSESPFILANVISSQTKTYRETHKTQALIRYTQTLFKEYIQNYSRIPPDIIIGVVQKKNCGELADYITSNIMLDFEQKQAILEELHPVKRLEKLNEILKNEIQVLSIESQISEKAKEQIDENQREYFLREQMKAISNELGDDDSPLSESDDLRERIAKMRLPKLQNDKLLKECDRLSKMPYGSHEASVIVSYVETCLELPWSTASREHIDLVKAQKVLDHDHFGLKKVKERIVEILAVKKLAPDIKGQIICLVGPPGVGKTSIARSIAKAIGRNYVRVSLGGVRDESDIMGHRKTYVGSMPGRIISAMKQAGTNNPLILLDEIDKLGNDFRGDPASALLEVLDSEQNSSFFDHYIDMPFDLSRVMFITTANDYSAIPEPLLDRMDVITLGSYTHEEKYNIAMKHLIPKQFKKHGINSKMLKVTPAAVHELIDGYTREAGVRNLERQIAAICRKCAKRIVEDNQARITVKPENLEELLGPKKFKKDELIQSDMVGLVNGLAWTSVGGELLPIEVAVMDGTGKIELTGSLGDVMKESARTAISCIRTRADSLGICHDFYSKYDIHIHAPEGAIPKDGPSAGTAMATAITSALTNIPIRHDVAMTGEITLLGRVLPIGGLKEKTMAAYRSGIKTVIIPADNVSDLAEIDAVVKNAVDFLPVEKIDQVLEAALTRIPEQKAEKGTDSLVPMSVSNQPAILTPGIPQ